ncbi:psbP domain-containing protein 3, chloroplastic isoform X2 [Ananas comosus]|uniref:PsbP domain-containing protein 3, chloroplastic isoform X2 n=1 Tax=Ananas comosus TaxID=4615 RepID=A0A6P5GRW2_ANACO|nr:psbP domain-containing protein 3, chloroplastic isoform X2 [Ananas comosus]
MASLRLPTTHPPRRAPVPAGAKGTLRCRSAPTRSPNNNPVDGVMSVVGFNEGLLGAIKRREALLQTFLSAVSFPLIIPTNDASAETDLQENFRMYEDEMNKFRILVPQDWLAGAGEASGIKSVTAFYPEEASDSNVSIVITGIGPDFTRLESFGSVDAFAESLVNGLDRSWQRPPGLAAKLVDSKAANGLYYLEYTLQNPGEKRRHILSAVGMASNGWYNRLYTVTGQYMEDESEKYRPKIEKVGRRKQLEIAAVLPFFFFSGTGRRSRSLGDSFWLCWNLHAAPKEVIC